MTAQQLRLFARMAASSLERDCALLSRRGYRGVELALSDLGTHRGALPAGTVRALLEEHVEGRLWKVGQGCGG